MASSRTSSHNKFSLNLNTLSFAGSQMMGRGLNDVQTERKLVHNDSRSRQPSPFSVLDKDLHL